MSDLARTWFGEGGDGVPLVIAHGLFGSGRNWRRIAQALSEGQPVVTVDMRNHGESFADPEHSYAAMADDLARVVDDAGGRADLMGHSMGGKAAMMLALTRPEKVRRLIVADMAPVAYDHDLSHFIDAMRAVDLSEVRSRSDADRQMAASVDSKGIRAFLAQSLDTGAEGGPRWTLNLDVLDAAMADISGWPAPEGRFDGPALFLGGGASDYLAPETHDAVRAAFPKARIETVEGAGHWLHAENPDAVIAAVRDHLAG